MTCKSLISLNTQLCQVSFPVVHFVFLSLANVPKKNTLHTHRLSPVSLPGASKHCCERNRKIIRNNHKLTEICVKHTYLEAKEVCLQLYKPRAQQPCFNLFLRSEINGRNYYSRNMSVVRVLSRAWWCIRYLWYSDPKKMTKCLLLSVGAVWTGL